MSLNQTLKNLSDFANVHYQINSFGAGEVSDFASSGTTQYPAMWVDFEPCLVEKGSFKQVLRVYLCDRVQKGNENLIEVLSDIQQICLDTIAQMSNPNYSWVLINDSITLSEFFESKFNDEVAGYYFDLTLKEKFDLNRCQIPVSANAPISTGIPLIVNIYDSNGNLLQTVTAPGSYTITTSGSANSVDIDFNANENISAYKVVTADGYNGDSSNTTQRNKIIGINKADVSTGFVGTCIGFGEMKNSAWSWLIGSKIFLNGTSLSTTAPSTGYNVIIGVATKSDTIDIKISQSILL